MSIKKCPTTTLFFLTATAYLSTGLAGFISPQIRHELKEQGLLSDFLIRFSFGQMGHFQSKNGTSS